MTKQKQDKDLLVPDEASNALANPEDLVMPFDGCEADDELSGGFLTLSCEYMKESRPEGFVAGRISCRVGPVWVEQINEISAAILHISYGRRMMPQWVPGEKDDPLCASSDGWTPDRGTEMMPGPCARKNGGRRRVPVCPNAQWGENNESPKCAEVYTLLCVKTDDGEPFVLRCAGTSIRPLREYRTLARELDYAKDYWTDEQ